MKKITKSGNKIPRVFLGCVISNAMEEIK